MDQTMIEINITQTDGHVVNKTYGLNSLGEIISVGKISGKKVMTIHEGHGLGEIISLLKDASVSD